MYYTNLFFQKRAYKHYDRFIVCCAAIVISTKYNNIHGKIGEISKTYFTINQKMMGQVSNIVKKEDINKVYDKIFLAETKIYKTFVFDIRHFLPNDYIIIYTNILYLENEEEVMSLSTKISNDHYYTLAPLCIKPYVIALSSIILAADILNLQRIDKEEGIEKLEKMKSFYFNWKQSKLNENTEDLFNKILLSFDNSGLNYSNQITINNENQYNFTYLKWFEKLHPFLNYAELYLCINMVNEFYNDNLSTYETNNPKKSSETSPSTATPYTPNS
jgi:hypothetical protein